MHGAATAAATAAASLLLFLEVAVVIVVVVWRCRWPARCPKIHANSFNSAQVASKLFVVAVVAADCCLLFVVAFIGCIKHDMPSQSRKVAQPSQNLALLVCPPTLPPSPSSFSFCLFCDDILNVPWRISFVLLRLFTFAPVLPCCCCCYCQCCCCVRVCMVVCCCQCWQCLLLPVLLS